MEYFLINAYSEAECCLEYDIHIWTSLRGLNSSFIFCFRDITQAARRLIGFNSSLINATPNEWETGTRNREIFCWICAGPSTQSRSDLTTVFPQWQLNQKYR